MSSWNYSYLAKAVYRFALLICLFEKNPPLPSRCSPSVAVPPSSSSGVIRGTGMVTSTEWHCSANCPPQAPAHRQCPRVSPSPGRCPGASMPRPLHTPQHPSLPPPASGQQGGPMACPSRPCVSCRGTSSQGARLPGSNPAQVLGVRGFQWHVCLL